MKQNLEKVIQTISTILDKRWNSESEVKIRVDSYEVLIDSGGDIIQVKNFGTLRIRN